MMSLWDALRMNMMISYQELVRTFPSIPLCCLSAIVIFLLPPLLYKSARIVPER